MRVPLGGVVGVWELSFWSFGGDVAVAVVCEDVMSYSELCGGVYNELSMKAFETEVGGGRGEDGEGRGAL